VHALGRPGLEASRRYQRRGVLNIMGGATREVSVVQELGNLRGRDCLSLHSSSVVVGLEDDEGREVQEMMPVVTSGIHLKLARNDGVETCRSARSRIPAIGRVRALDPALETIAQAQRVRSKSSVGPAPPDHRDHID
jgi:hypothetical protein